MNVVITEEAKNDLFDAIDYYESEQVGLGVRLRDEFAEVSVSIGGNPLLWRERPEGYRRVNLPVFPYYIAFVIRDNVIFIVALAHGSRKPGYWHERLKESPQQWDAADASPPP